MPDMLMPRQKRNYDVITVEELDWGYNPQMKRGRWQKLDKQTGWLITVTVINATLCIWSREVKQNLQARSCS